MIQMQTVHPKTRTATIPMVRATLLSIPISLFIIAVYGTLFLLLWGRPAPSHGLFGPLSFFFLLLLGVVVHEFLHALGWKLAGKVPWSSMKFGMSWKVLAPYAHCRVPLRADAYRTGILLPGLALGVLPGIVGLATGEFLIAFWGALFTAAASGDLLGYWAIRSVPGDAKVIDHPTELGCEVIEE